MFKVHCASVNFVSCSPQMTVCLTYLPTYNKLYTLAEYFHWKCLFCICKNEQKNSLCFTNLFVKSHANIICILTVGAQGAFWSISVNGRWPRNVIFFISLQFMCVYELA